MRRSAAGIFSSVSSAGELHGAAAVGACCWSLVAGCLGRRPSASPVVDDAKLEWGAEQTRLKCLGDDAGQRGARAERAAEAAGAAKPHEGGTKPRQVSAGEKSKPRPRRRLLLLTHCTLLTIACIARREGQMMGRRSVRPSSITVRARLARSSPPPGSECSALSARPGFAGQGVERRRRLARGTV